MSRIDSVKGSREQRSDGSRGRRRIAITFPQDDILWNWIHDLAKGNKRGFSQQVIELLRIQHERPK